MKPGIVLLLLSLLTAVLAAPVMALEPTLVLYPVIRLPTQADGSAAPTLSVESVARVVAPRAAREALASAAVPVLSLQGRSSIDKQSLAALLHAVPGLEAFEVVGPETVRVRAQHSAQRTAQMLSEARAFLEQHVAATWPGEYRNLSFSFAGKQAELPVGPQVRWHFDAAGLTQLRRRSAVWVVLGEGGERLPLWFKVEGEVRAWNAIDDIAGKTLAEEPLFAEGWADLAGVDPGERATPAADHQLTVAMKAGEVLVLRHLEPAPAVEFGADALVISRAGGIEITATATALRRGFVGDTIALRARNSDESFDAVVTGRNRVEVTDRATH